MQCNIQVSPPFLFRIPYIAFYATGTLLDTRSLCAKLHRGITFHFRFMCLIPYHLLPNETARLLTTTSLEVQEFGDYDVPPYVILSHTWDVEEVTLKDLEGTRTANNKG